MTPKYPVSTFIAHAVVVGGTGNITGAIIGHVNVFQYLNEINVILVIAPVSYRILLPSIIFTPHPRYNKLREH